MVGLPACAADHQSCNAGEIVVSKLPQGSFLLWFCSVVVCTVTHSPNEWKCPDLVLRGVWCKNLPNQKCRLNCSGDSWWIWEQLRVVVWMSLGKLQRLGVYHTKTKKHFKLESPVNQRSLSVDCMRETHASRACINDTHCISSTETPGTARYTDKVNPSIFLTACSIVGGTVSSVYPLGLWSPPNLELDNQKKLNGCHQY